MVLRQLRLFPFWGLEKKISRPEALVDSHPSSSTLMGVPKVVEV